MSRSSLVRANSRFNRRISASAEGCHCREKMLSLVAIFFEAIQRKGMDIQIH
ncbi:MAG: hypothetical protein H6629_09205 [Calditrichae bacterium]|nr:hypothetical protein [Calditrichia bacterium]